MQPLRVFSLSFDFNVTKQPSFCSNLGSLDNLVGTETRELERKVVIASLAEEISSSPSSSLNRFFIQSFCMSLDGPGHQLFYPVGKRSIHFFEKYLQFLPVSTPPISLFAVRALIDRLSKPVHSLPFHPA